jgi:aspartyl-tRNA(Asn)/glutamyl-tRNA(Gln) amidotransferase subunit A
VSEHPADLGVTECAGLLRARQLSARELAAACLERIDERDGHHSHEGDPDSINAWVRVYPDDALAAADRADERLAAGDAPALCGIPIGLKDLYAVAGKPLTASSTILDDVPARDCDAWARLRAEGMVLLGHLHTHEFAAGGTTDQVGNPWGLELSAGGSSGGSSAALAARTTPAATGTDTAGSVRIPSAITGTSTIKPTRGLSPMRGIVPLSPSLDHAGPMTRALADCEPLLEALLATQAPSERRPLRRLALSPRIPLVDLDPDVADGLETVLGLLGATVVAVPPPEVELDLGGTFIDVVCTEMLAYHRRFDAQRRAYRPSIRGFLEHGERRALTGEEYVAIQQRRAETTVAFVDWLDEHRIDALVEPTLSIVAHARGTGYDEAFTDFDEISLTHYWNWTGFPVAALPAGVGARSGLPVSVSLIGRPHADWDVLAAGVALQAEIGTVSP